MLFMQTWELFTNITGLCSYFIISFVFPLHAGKFAAMKLTCRILIFTKQGQLQIMSMRITPMNFCQMIFLGTEQGAQIQKLYCLLYVMQRSYSMSFSLLELRLLRRKDSLLANRIFFNCILQSWEETKYTLGQSCPIKFIEFYK